MISVRWSGSGEHEVGQVYRLLRASGGLLVLHGVWDRTGWVGAHHCNDVDTSLEGRVARVLDDQVSKHIFANSLLVCGNVGFGASTRANNSKNSTFYNAE